TSSTTSSAPTATPTCPQRDGLCSALEAYQFKCAKQGKLQCILDRLTKAEQARGVQPEWRWQYVPCQNIGEICVDKADGSEPTCEQGTPEQASCPDTDPTQDLDVSSCRRAGQFCGYPRQFQFRCFNDTIIA